MLEENQDGSVRTLTMNNVSVPIWDNMHFCVRFEVLTVVTMKNGVF
jgi:hypothetical protein